MRRGEYSSTSNNYDDDECDSERDCDEEVTSHATNKLKVNADKDT